MGPELSLDEGTESRIMRREGRRIAEESGRQYRVGQVIPAMAAEHVGEETTPFRPGADDSLRATQVSQAVEPPIKTGTSRTT